MPSESPPPAAPESSAPAPRRKRRWLRYSLRTLFALTTLCALAAYQAGQWIRQMDDEERAIATLEAVPDNRFWIERARPEDEERNLERPPKWFRNLVGRGNFSNVHFVKCGGRTINPSTGEITLGMPPPMVNGDLALFTAFRGVTHLSLDCRGVDEAALQQLRGPRHVQELYLFLDKLSDTGVAAVWLPSLELLSFQVDVCNVRDWSSLRSSPALRELQLCVRQELEGGLGSLSRIASVHELLLTGAGIGDDDLRAIAEMKNVTTLRLGFPLRGAGLTDLGQLPKLSVLFLNCAELDALHLRSLHKVQTLRVVSLVGYPNLDRLPEALDELDQIEKLHIYGEPLTAAHAKGLPIRFARALPHLKRLTLPPVLGFHGNVFPQSFDEEQLAALRREPLEPEASQP